MRSVVSLMLVLVGLSCEVTMAYEHYDLQELQPMLRLVDRQNGELSTMREQHRLLAAERNWSAVVRLGARTDGTLDAGEGLTAGLAIEIPLFSQATEKARVENRQQMHSSQSGRQTSFITALSRLRLLDASRFSSTETRRITRDKLLWHREAQQDSRIDPAALWQPAEQAQRAEQMAARAEVEYQAEFDSIIVEYGGTEWKTLATLLAAYVKSSRPWQQ